MLERMFVGDPPGLHDRMFVGDPPGLHDRLLDFSTPQTGTTFFVPTAELLASLADG